MPYAADDGAIPVVPVPESFSLFYQRERSGMVGLAYVLSGSRLAAEDIAQDALIAAYRHWDEVGRLDQPSAWVRRVVANNSFSMLRRLKAEARAVGRMATSGRWAPIPELLPSTVELWHEVRRLPRRQAETVALYYLAGHTMPEIAGLLGCSKETVNTHLRRARSNLAQRLGMEDEQL